MFDACVALLTGIVDGPTGIDAAERRGRGRRRCLQNGHVLRTPLLGQRALLRRKRMRRRGRT